MCFVERSNKSSWDGPGCVGGVKQNFPLPIKFYWSSSAVLWKIFIVFKHKKQISPPRQFRSTLSQDRHHRSQAISGNFQMKKSLVFYRTKNYQFFLVFFMKKTFRFFSWKKTKKQLIVFSPVEELRFFHFGREQSIHGLRSTHFIFETEILLQRQITSRLNGLTQKECYYFCLRRSANIKVEFCKASHVVESNPNGWGALTILWKMKILSCTKVKSDSWIICCYWYRKLVMLFVQGLKLKSYADSIGTYKFLFFKLRYVFIFSHNITIRMHALHCFPKFKLHIFQLASVVLCRLVESWNSSWIGKPASSTYQTRVLNLFAESLTLLHCKRLVLVVSAQNICKWKSNQVISFEHESKQLQKSVVVLSFRILSKFLSVCPCYIEEWKKERMKWYVLNGYHQSVLKKLLKKKSLKKNSEKTNLEKNQFFSWKKPPGFLKKNQLSTSEMKKPCVQGGNQKNLTCCLKPTDMRESWRFLMRMHLSFTTSTEQIYPKILCEWDFLFTGTWTDVRLDACTVSFLYM